jgi:hypothetical protein
MNHEAVYKLYPQVVRILDEQAFDAEGNEVAYDAQAVAAWVSPDQYKRDRASAYPSLGDQLDMMYWDKVNGTTTWQDAIAAVKSENPKA